MVLLTSSAISVAISSSVVCTFTFLLFLSGYVLQQQTVRSLQEALRRPPPPLTPIPSLPAAFREHEDQSDFLFPDGVDHVVVGKQQEGGQDTIKLDGEAIVEATELDRWANSPAPSSTPSSAERLAYILSLPHPSSLCSALLFTKAQREQTHLLYKPSIIYLYPSTWERTISSTNTAALNLMRDIQERYDLIYHPVDINPFWIAAGVEAQLLGELQRTQWDYDRVMYLKSPGLALDTSKLDGALRFSNLKKSWAPLSASVGMDPDILLISREKGIMVPRGNMRKLTASAITSHANHHESEMDLEAVAKHTAYIVFADAELDHRKSEKEWYGGLFERFERGRRGMCADRGLLEDNEDRLDLRRRVK